MSYHNLYHAVDVMHATYLTLESMGASGLLTQTEQFALILSALCHDLDHPGLTNSFQACHIFIVALLFIFFGWWRVGLSVSPLGAFCPPKSLLLYSCYIHCSDSDGCELKRACASFCARSSDDRLFVTCGRPVLFTSRSDHLSVGSFFCVVRSDSVSPGRLSIPTHSHSRPVPCFLASLSAAAAFWHQSDNNTPSMPPPTPFRLPRRAPWPTCTTTRRPWSTTTWPSCSRY